MSRTTVTTEKFNPTLDCQMYPWRMVDINHVGAISSESVKIQLVLLVVKVTWIILVPIVTIQRPRLYRILCY